MEFQKKKMKKKNQLLKILNIEEKYKNDIKEIENKMNLQIKEYQI